MRYYTETIPVTLAEKLKAKGMPIETEGENIYCPSYAEVVDWFMEHDLYISVKRFRRFSSEPHMYRGCACDLTITDGEGITRVWIHQPKICDTITWNEMMNSTIERALHLITESNQ